MLSNRSIPSCTVIPCLPYADVNAAAGWLCDAFGFTVRVRIGDHRVQLNVGDGAVMLGDTGSEPPGIRSVIVRVEDAHSHCDRARRHGATILKPPTDHPYGERQYNAQDFAGHRWTFSQSIADVAPEDWGGTSVQL
jgi:uncharacterized glyoxalase superfamily protein PhnB